MQIDWYIICAGLCKMHDRYCLYKGFIVSFTFHEVFEEKERSLTNVEDRKQLILQIYFVTKNKPLDGVPVSSPLTFSQRVMSVTCSHTLLCTCATQNLSVTIKEKCISVYGPCFCVCVLFLSFNSVFAVRT